MSDIVIVNGRVYIAGDSLINTINAIACDELPVDEKWVSGLKYACVIIRDKMRMEEE